MVRFFYIFAFFIIASISNTNDADALIYNLDLSKTTIIKDSEFQGDEIIVSGLIRGGGNIITSVTGPNKGYIIWKKEYSNGIWINSKHLNIPSTFSFFQIYATNSLEKITDYDTLKILSLDLDYNSYFSSGIYDKSEMLLFNRAFKEYQQSVGQYLDSMNPIEVIGGSIFRIKIKLNSTVPIGEYNIKIAEFENGKLTQTENLKFEVKQNEFFTQIDNTANNSPLTYALIAIMIAIIIGGTVGLLFNGEKV